MTETVSLNVTILGKEFCLACPADEKQALQESVRLVNEKIQQIRHGGKVVGNERIAVMAALHLASELNQIRQADAARSDSYSERLQRIQERIDHVLSQVNPVFP